MKTTVSHSCEAYEQALMYDHLDKSTIRMYFERH
jgi:hypothetical protein